MEAVGNLNTVSLGKLGIPCRLIDLPLLVEIPKIEQHHFSQVVELGADMGYLSDESEYGRVATVFRC